MEEVKFEVKERYRIQLEEPIVNFSRKIEFRFTSHHTKDKALYVSDDDRNRGELKIKDLNNGNIWTATYYLTFFPSDICHVTIQFNEFILKSTDIIGVYEANNVSYRFDEMVKYLKKEFPSLPLKKT